MDQALVWRGLGRPGFPGKSLWKTSLRFAFVWALCGWSSSSALSVTSPTSPAGSPEAPALYLGACGSSARFPHRDKFYGGVRPCRARDSGAAAAEGFDWDPSGPGSAAAGVRFRSHDAGRAVGHAEEVQCYCSSSSWAGGGRSTHHGGTDPRREELVVRSGPFAAQAASSHLVSASCAEQLGESS